MDIPANPPAMWAAKDTLGEKEENGNKWKNANYIIQLHPSYQITNTIQSDKTIKSLKNKELGQETQRDVLYAKIKSVISLTLLSAQGRVIDHHPILDRSIEPTKSWVAWKIFIGAYDRT